eukprot:comp4120_c0_seq1/m.2524 comp4120_c0_seq1/g.2524  ORF comp4120_c0_seq1/g.2524 comp4120_c0_seq1/m.2524 type:complete len:207 (+) comp4120_c0_seq1:2-622(+)
MPVQRIPRYELLLRDLIKYTDPDHPDRGQLEMALEKIISIAKQVNESKERQERMAKVWEIQNRFAAKPVFETLVQPHRKFIREDVFIKKPSSGKKTGRDRERTFFLFNDVIVYSTVGKSSTTKLEFKGIIHLIDVTVSPSADQPTGFDIISNVGVFKITCPDTKTRDAWVVLVEDQKNALQELFMRKQSNMSHVLRGPSTLVDLDD